jgi:glycosyltransferase involved in cell wall biosynthesis
MARVAVIIPVLNGAETIGEAIDSVLAQTFRDFELTVVDDGSTDATPAVLDRYNGAMHRITQTNAGISAARNAALRASTSEFVALLDCDDLWRPAMLERCVTALDHDNSSVLAFTNLELTDSNGTALDTSLVGAATAHAPTLDEMLTQLWPIMPSAVLMRRRALEAIGGFAEEFRSYGYEDVYCWMRLREIGTFQYIPEALVRWRFAPFPRPLKLVSPNLQARATFERLVRERWGREVAPLLESRRRASRSILGYIGLTELRNGNTPVAREAFRRALRLDPWRLKNYLRLVRTYLPGTVARALGGRTTRRIPHADQSQINC